jgi:hypothetical protein
MSILFFDGFDYTNISYGQGGMKWDQGSSGGIAKGAFSVPIPGRFGDGFVMAPGGSYPGSTYLNETSKTFSENYSSLVVGFAMIFNEFYGANPPQPFLIFMDGNNPQCSLKLRPDTGTIALYTEAGLSPGDTMLADTGYVPPLTLWFYIEVKVVISGIVGSVVIQINSTPVVSVSSIQTQSTGNSSTNRIILSSSGTSGLMLDDLYVIDPTDAIGNVDFLGEVRVQTQYPDAEGYQNDFFPSTGTNNADNVNTIPVDYSPDYAYLNNKSKNGPVDYNYSGTVGAKDLYSIGNFTVSGQIFAVQENISFRKDDVGNRQVGTMLRTNSENYNGSNFLCYSSYTYGGTIWENNPNTEAPWELVDLNETEFGVEITE